MTAFPPLKLKVLPTFPADIRGGTGIRTTKQNGHVVVDMDWDEFSTNSTVPTSPTNNVLTFDTATDQYVMIPSSLLGGAVAGISDAPVDGIQYARQSASWTPVIGGSFTQAGTGAVTRTMQDKAREQVSALDFGATGNGVTNDTTALANAFAAAAANGKSLYIPRGTYITNQTLTQPERLIVFGDGPRATEIRCSVANLPVISFVGGSGGRGCILRDLMVSHSGTPTAGGHGVHAPWLGNMHEISNVQSYNNYVGFNLGPVSYARIANCIAANNVSHGFHITDSLGGDGINFGPFQWQSHSNYAEANGGDGHLWQTQFASAAIGNVIGPQTFLNSGAGMRFLGKSASIYLSAIRVSDVFLGDDNGAAEIVLDTFYNGVAQFDTVYIEQSGGSAGTGPGPSHPAANTGAQGIYITANNGFVQFNTLTVLGSQSHGIYSAAGNLVISNAVISNNGVTAGSGIVSDVAGKKVKLANVWTGNYTAAPPGQTHGLYGASGADWSWSNLDGTGNLTALATFAANPINGTTTSAISTGTWTPVDASGAGLTFTGVTASYQRIGNMVFAYAQLSWPSTANGTAAVIGGLPFITISSGSGRQCLLTATSEPTLAWMVPAPSATTIALQTASGGAITNSTMSTDIVFFTAIYPTP